MLYQNIKNMIKNELYKKKKKTKSSKNNYTKKK